jgi:hypothetical protein
MMSSFQAGLARGREAAEGVPDRSEAPVVVDDAPPARDEAARAPGQSTGLDGGEQSGAQGPDADSGGRAGRRRRTGGGADGEATEAT